MINLTNASLKIYLALQPCDMRKSFQGLSELATEHLGQELVREALFVFVNKRRNRIKLLYFDGSGTWVAAKRLESGTFNWPTPTNIDKNKSEKSNRTKSKKLKLAPEALQLILDGIDLKETQRRDWYQLD